MSEHDLHIETVTVGEQALLEIEAAYRNGVEPESLAETHIVIANAIRFHLKQGTVSKQVSDVSKTNELIEEARFYESPGHVAAYAEGTLELLRKLADALEAQTGVRVDMSSAVGVETQLAEELRPSEMTAEEAVELVLKRPGMYGLVPDTEHRSMKAERDAALAVIGRVRAEAAAYAQQPDVMEPCGAAAQSILTALDGAPELEWVYTVGGIGEDGNVWADDPEYWGESGDPGIAELWVEVARESGSFANAIVVKRRKAGPWLPVEGESNDA